MNCHRLASTELSTVISPKGKISTQPKSLRNYRIFHLYNPVVEKRRVWSLQNADETESVNGPFLKGNKLVVQKKRKFINGAVLEKAFHRDLPLENPCWQGVLLRAAVLRHRYGDSGNYYPVSRLRAHVEKKYDGWVLCFLVRTSG